MRLATLRLLAKADEVIRATARRLRSNRRTLDRLDRLRDEAETRAQEPPVDFVRPMSHASPLRDAIDDAQSGSANYVPSWAEPLAKKGKR